MFHNAKKTFKRLKSKQHSRTQRTTEEFASCPLGWGDTLNEIEEQLALPISINMS